MLQNNKFFFNPKYIFFALAIAAASVFAYLTSLSNGFTHWDDHLYIVENASIRQISWNNIKIIFSTIYVGNYAPVQMVSYMMDYLFWGNNLFGFHLTNILIHALNASLLFYIIRKYFSTHTAAAGAAALIFALHPVNVESVAWLSQRKNVLSLLFFLLSLVFYLEYLLEPLHKGRNYFTSYLFFIFALLTKSIAVILPVLILLIEYCFYRKRFNLLYNKVLFYVTMFLFCAITYYTQNAQDAIGRNYEGGLYAGLVTMSKIYFYYLSNLFFPVNLSADYVPLISLSLLEFIPLLSSAILFFTLCVISYYRKKQKVLFFCMVWFFIALLPVSNIIPLATLMADRYLYYPSISFAILLSTGFFSIHSRCIKRGMVILLFTILLSYSSITFNRNKIWENDLSLWTDTLKKSPNSIPALNNLSYYYALNNIDLDLALRLSEKSLFLDPDNIECLDTMAFILLKKGDLKKAQVIIKKALQIDSSLLHLRGELEKIEKNSKE